MRSKIVGFYKCWKCQTHGITLYKVGPNIYACWQHKDEKKVKPTSREEIND